VGAGFNTRPRIIQAFLESLEKEAIMTSAIFKCKTISRRFKTRLNKQGSTNCFKKIQKKQDQPQIHTIPSA